MDDYDQGNGLSAFAAYEIGRAHGSSGKGTAQVMASVRNRLRGPRYDVRDLLQELQQAHERERGRMKHNTGVPTTTRSALGQMRSWWN